VVQLDNGSMQKITNQNKAQQVKGKKISHLAEAVAFQYAERSPRGNAPAPMSACNIADQSRLATSRIDLMLFCDAAIKIRLCLRQKGTKGANFGLYGMAALRGFTW
jgi:hypothetical protein